MLDISRSVFYYKPKGESAENLHYMELSVEWTVKTPGVSGRAQRRIVVNKTTFQACYTHDHYKNFIEISLTDF